MLKSRLLSMSLLATLIAMPAFAQTSTPTVNAGTNAADQQQIQQGLQNGSLSTGEAKGLERSQQHLDQAESNGVSQQQLNQMQSNIQNKTNALENNSTTGNPAAAADQKMQADVQRSANQQNRIQQGVNSGQVTSGEEARLEHGQARVNKAEANGHLKKANAMATRQSKGINHKKHNKDTTAPGTATP